LQCGCENLACPFCNLVESIRNRNIVFSNRKHSIIYQVSLYVSTFDTGAQYSVIDNEVLFMYYLSVYISTADARKVLSKTFPIHLYTVKISALVYNLNMEMRLLQPNPYWPVTNTTRVPMYRCHFHVQVSKSPAVSTV
jgi:hypothetical protein